MPSWALPTGTISIGITSHRESRCRTRSLNRSMAGSGTKCSTRPCSRASPTPGLPCENGEPTIMEIAHTRGSAGSPQPNTQPPLPHDWTWRCAQWPAPRQPPSSTRLSRAKTTPGVYVTLDKRWGQRHCQCDMPNVRMRAFVVMEFIVQPRIALLQLSLITELKRWVAKMHGPANTFSADIDHCFRHALGTCL